MVKKDIDECADPLLCSQDMLCQNSIGDFNCTRCPPGYHTNALRTQCLGKLT